MEGRGYGGAVATGAQFQTSDWAVPAPCNPALDCRFHTDFAGGNFNFSDSNHFALDVFLGAGHNNAHLVGLGHREGVTASAAEPTTLVIVAAGLLAAHALGRRRRSV